MYRNKQTKRQTGTADLLFFLSIFILKNGLKITYSYFILKNFFKSLIRLAFAYKNFYSDTSYATTEFNRA